MLLVSAAVTVLTVVGVGASAVIDSREYPTPGQVVRAACHAAGIVRVGRTQVMWQASDSLPGTGWIASVHHESGGRYVVENCEDKGYGHG